jgi:hypothetical protein
MGLKDKLEGDLRISVCHLGLVAYTSVNGVLPSAGCLEAAGHCQESNLAFAGPQAP